MSPLVFIPRFASSWRNKKEMKKLIHSTCLIVVLFFSFSLQAGFDFDNPHHQLYRAIKRTYFDKVVELLGNEEIDINAMLDIGDRNGYKPEIYRWSGPVLHTAVEHTNDERIVEAILARPDIDVNARNSRGWPALFVAIEKVENPKIIEALVRQPGIDLTITTEGGYLDGRNALHIAAGWAQNRETVEIILQAVDAEVANAEDKSGTTPLQRVMYDYQRRHRPHLHQSIIDVFLSDPKIQVDVFELFKIAIDRNDFERVEELLSDERISRKIRDAKYRGQTILQYAVYTTTDARIVRALADHVDVNAKTVNGSTALLTAVREAKSKGVVKALLDTPGLDVSVEEERHRELLEEAASWKNSQAVEALLEDPRFDPNKPDKDGKTLLHRIAAYVLDAATIDTIFKNPELKIDSVDNEGWLPLHYAANRGNEHFVRAYLNHADFDIEMLRAEEGNRGATPVHLAVIAGDYRISQQKLSLEVVKLFLDHPDMTAEIVNTPDHYGRTLVHYMSINPRVKNLKVLKFVLNHSMVNPNAKDSNGETFLHYLAENSESKTVIEVALNHPRVIKNPRDNFNSTPFHGASRVSESPKVIEAFLNDPEVLKDVEDNRGHTPEQVAKRNPLAYAVFNRYAKEEGIQHRGSKKKKASSRGSEVVVRGFFSEGSVEESVEEKLNAKDKTAENVREVSTNGKKSVGTKVLEESNVIQGNFSREDARKPCYE